MGTPQIPAPMVLVPPRKRRRWVLPVVIAVVVVVVLIGVAGALVFLADVSGVNVSAINWSGSSCGALSGTSSRGFTGPEGGSLAYSIAVVNEDPILSCTISSVTATTPGFAITGGDLPLTIPAGGSQVLSVTIGLPSSAYAGALTLSVT